MKMEEHRQEAPTRDDRLCSLFLVAWTPLSTGVKHTLTTTISICFSTSLFWKRMLLFAPRKQHSLSMGDSSQTPEPVSPLLSSLGKNHSVTNIPCTVMLTCLALVLGMPGPCLYFLSKLVLLFNTE